MKTTYSFIHLHADVLLKDSDIDIMWLMMEFHFEENPEIS